MMRPRTLLALAALGEEEDFAEIDGRYPDDSMCGTLYNRALMAFNSEPSDRKKADALLKGAIKRNPHVVDLLLGDDEPPTPGSYTLGSAEEAASFARYAWATWLALPDALEWLKETIRPQPSKA